MLRTTIYATLIVILAMEAASAQTDIQGGQNSLRTDQEKKNDRAVDRAYRSAIKRVPDAEKEKAKSDPWADVRQASPAPAKNKQ